MDTVNDNNKPDRPNAVVLKALEQFLNEKFPEQRHTIDIQLATVKGQNYVGVVHRVLVKFDVIDNKELSLILKVPPQNEIRRKRFFARPSFLREARAYDQFLPMFEKFQKEKDISYELSFHEYPKCYLTLVEEMNEAIILEDLRKDKFELFDRFKQIDRDHVALVMRAYGKLHAVSLAIKDQQKEKVAQFQELTDIFEEHKDDVQLVGYFEEFKKNALASLNAEKDRPYVETLEKFFAKGKLFDIYLDLLSTRNCEKYAVVCHGDCWINNFLFKHENGKVVDLRLLDWQVMRYASPTVDIIYFLICSTNKNFRDKHYKDMLDIYYNELSEHLKRLGSDPHTIYPKDAFKDQLLLHGAIGLVIAMMVIPIITIKSEDVPSLDELAAQLESATVVQDVKQVGFLVESNAIDFNRLMRETIIDCIDFGFL